PLDQQQNHVGVLGGLEHRGRIPQLGVLLTSPIQGGRVVHGHLGTQRGDGGGHVQGGRVADVVGVGFEGGAQHGHGAAGEVSPDELTCYVDGACAAALVDGVDLAQEGQRWFDPELIGTGHEGANVLRQAATTEPETGAQELAADAVVVGQRLGELHDVGTRDLRHLGHGVDEGDLGGQEGVCRHLDQLGGLHVGDQEGHTLVDLALPQGTHDLLHPGRVGADDDAVRVQGVLDPKTFAEELRAPTEFGLFPDGGECGQTRGQGRGGADRDGGATHDHSGPGQVWGELLDGGVDIAQVGRTGVVALRGPDADQVQVGEFGGLGEGCGETQAAGLHVLGEYFVEAGLVERDLARTQHVDLVLVDVDPDHLEAHVGEAGSGGCAQVAGPDDRDAHEFCFDHW